MLLGGREWEWLGAGGVEADDDRDDHAGVAAQGDGMGPAAVNAAQGEFDGGAGDLGIGGEEGGGEAVGEVGRDLVGEVGSEVGTNIGEGTGQGGAGGPAASGWW